MRGDATAVDTKQLACCGAEDHVDDVGCLQPQKKIGGRRRVLVCDCCVVGETERACVRIM